MSETPEQTFEQSLFRDKLATLICQSSLLCTANDDPRLKDAIGRIGHFVDWYVDCRCGSAGGRVSRTSDREALRKLGKAMLDLSSEIKDARESVQVAIYSLARPRQEAAKDAVSDSPPPTIEEFDIDGIQTLLERCGKVWMDHSLENSRRPSLSNEGFLTEFVLGEWELLTGRTATNTRKRVEKDGSPPFRRIMEIIQSYVNDGPGKLRKFELTSENLNTVLDKVFKSRRQGST
jgi:hypothetical protein